MRWAARLILVAAMLAAFLAGVGAARVWTPEPRPCPVVPEDFRP